MRLPQVIFHDTSPSYAWELVAQYAEGTFEQRFGYPSGYFFIEKARTMQPDRLSMKEMQPVGAITDGCASSVGGFSNGALKSGCAPVGCVVAVIGICCGLPFFIASALDRFCRAVLCSRVDVRFTASAADTVVSFTFYGPSAWALRGRYAKAFDRPLLPPELAVAHYAPPPRVPGPPTPTGGAK